ncbi:holo-ACP synthase [Aquitalea magnusonii]|uniref:Holo-[acyl-carrier-protein] synthase n=1 Tax=Aquitalea magnusonii TaxID=332411 RepID=A0A318JHP7_9NEIS|nr:holo-ACP synthase [Aquitalea magnusonii]PXX48229.1 holo-[acyl-carrier protein] synthase [Aquitalea magnusonii]
MIYGIGTDMVEIARMQGLLQRWGDKAGRRILAEAEMPAFLAAADQARFLAKRFAVKEALSKAVGTGVVAPVLLTAIVVSHDAQGKPMLEFGAELQDFLVQRGVGRSHVSISDEREHALAFVVLERDESRSILA